MFLFWHCVSHWTQLPYGTLYISVFATGSNCGWMALTCQHLLAWSVYMPRENWGGILMGHSPVRISCHLSQPCWWMDGRYQMRNDSLLLQQWEKMRAGESGGWWWVRGTGMGTRGQNHLKPSFRAFLFLSLLSSTPYFFLVLHHCSQQEFCSFARARIESLSVSCFPSVSFLFLPFQHFHTFVHQSTVQQRA